VLAGVGLVAAATVGGAWLARGRPGQRQIWFAAAAGALLIIAGVHLLPDAWAGARTARIWPALVPAAAVTAGAFPVPAAAEPVLLAVAAGVLAQAARVSLRAAFGGLRPARLLLSRPAATTAMAAIVTVLAVRGAG
jgi:hypothetical protein